MTGGGGQGLPISKLGVYVCDLQWHNEWRTGDVS